MAPGGVEAVTVRERGWDSKKHGELLALAEKEFDVVLTTDQGIPHQQDLSQFDLTVVVLSANSNRLSGSPRAEVGFWAYPNQIGEHVAVAAVEQLSNRGDWQRTDVDELEPESEYEVRKDAALATFLQKDDHIAAVKDFFIESIREIKEELVTLKKEHPDLPWAGEQDPSEER